MTNLNWFCLWIKDENSKKQYLKMHLLGMLNSWNFAEMLILMLKTNLENLRLIFQRSAENLSNTAKIWPAKYKTSYRMRSRSPDITQFTGWCRVKKIQIVLKTRTENGHLWSDEGRFYEKLVCTVSWIYQRSEEHIIMTNAFDIREST